MSQQQPSVGRIVHYHVMDIDNEVPVDEVAENRLTLRPIAGIITDVYAVPVSSDPECAEEQVVNMTCFTPTGGIVPTMGIPFSEEPKLNHWSWPPRV